jgi:integrase
MKLTQKSAAALKLPVGKTDHIEWCDDLPGFGLRLRGNDHRAWVAQYRIHGRSRRLTIALFKKFSAEQARLEAKRIFAEVALGRDPAAAKEADRASATKTMSTIVDDYLAMKQSTLRPDSYRITKAYLTGYHFKPLHSRGIAAIGRGDIAHCLDKVNRDSGRVTASRARAALSAFFVWAMKRGHCDSNPVAATEDPGPAQARERVLSDSELAAIWNACLDDDYGKIVRLLILTGCRREEIGGLRWSEITPLSPRSIVLPKERTKNKHTHNLPLLELAQAIIDSVPQMVGRDHLFGERSTGGFGAWWRAKAALDARLGNAVGAWRLHDIRRTVATRMADIGVLPHVIETVLNHTSGHKRGVAGIYNLSPYKNEVKIALAKWEDHLRSLLEGSGRKILNFPQAARENA